MTILLIAIAYFSAIAYAHRWFKRSTGGYVYRHGIDTSALFVEKGYSPINSPVYERRVRQTQLPDWKSDEPGSMHEVEEFRRVTMVPGLAYATVIGKWFFNTIEHNSVDGWSMKPMMELRPLADYELRLEWPQAVQATISMEHEVLSKEEADALMQGT